MASIIFSIRSSGKESVSSIYLRLRDGRETDLKVRTGYRVYTEYWNVKKNCLQSNIVYTDSVTANENLELKRNLENLKEYILINLARLKEKPTIKWLEKEIKQHHSQGSKSRDHRTKSSGKGTLNQYIEKWIVDIETGHRTHSGGKKYQPGTVKSFKGFQVQFNEFQGRKRLNFDAITLETYDDIVRFFNNKNSCPNNTGKFIKHLKTIMRAASEEGYHNNLEIERKAFKVIRVPVDNIFLTEVEIRRMFDLDLKEKPTLEVARDVFLAGCYTAQRYGDYSRINKDMVQTLSNGAKAIELIQQKTGERVIIPIRAELNEILKKYDYALPKTWQQKVNDRIKEVGELAEITDPVQLLTVKGGRKEYQTVQKNTLIKTHTARRSGCSNMYLAGMKILQIMRISGHKTQTEFLKYIKVTNEENAVEVSDHAYFNPVMLKIEK